MDGDLLHPENLWEFPTSGLEADYGESTLEKIQWNLTLPPAGGGDAVGGIGGTGNVHFHKAEHGGLLHTNQVHPRPVPGSGEAVGSAGAAEGVGAGGDWFHWCS